MIQLQISCHAFRASGAARRKWKIREKHQRRNTASSFRTIRSQPLHHLTVSSFLGITAAPPVQSKTVRMSTIKMDQTLRNSFKTSAPLTFLAQRHCCAGKKVMRTKVLPALPSSPPPALKSSINLPCAASRAEPPFQY